MSAAVPAPRREPDVFESPDIVEAVKEDEKKPEAKVRSTGSLFSARLVMVRILQDQNDKAKFNTEDVIRSEIRPQLAYEQFAHRLFDTSSLSTRHPCFYSDCVYVLSDVDAVVVDSRFFRLGAEASVRPANRNQLYAPS